MAKQSPYVLSKTEGHILSHFASRTNRTIIAKEIRLSINGWTSQALIHDCPSCAEIVSDDLVPYVRDKGYDVTGGATLMDKALTRLTTTIADSKPLCAEYIPGYGMWRLGVETVSLPWPTALERLAETIRAERKAAMDYMFFANFDGTPRWCGHVASWRVGSNGSALVDGFTSKGMPTPTAETSARIKDPVKWFEQKLRDCGVPLELFKYDGVIDSCNRNSGSAWVNTQGIGNTYAGATRLVGPMDALGFRPVWTGPQLGDVALWICDAGAGVQGQVNYNAIGCKWKVYKPNVSTTTLSRAELIAACPNAGFETSSIYGFIIYNERDVNLIFKHGTAGRPAYGSYPYAATLASLLPFAADTWVGVDVGVPSVMQFKQSRWMIANGKGVVEWQHQAAPYVQVGSAADGFGLDTWSASPASVTFRVSMVAIREYISLQLTRDDLTAADRAKLVKALKDSEPYVDSLISVAVSDTQISACGLADVHNLEMVKAAAKGDVNLMTEDLGNGVTLTVLGKRLEALRAKGRKFCTYGHVVDEAATTDQIVSARVAGTLSTATSWDLSLVVNEIEGPVVYGAYSAGQKEMLTSTEVALLWLRGARSQDGTISESVIADTLGMGSSWVSDLSAMGTQKLIGTGAGRTAWGATSVSWDKFSAFSFCDYLGYPVVGFTDKDTLVRQQLLFKSGESDPADLACAIFFANQLSFTTPSK